MFVLILVLSTINGEAITTQEFMTKARCLEARQIVMDNTYGVRAFCVQQ